MPRHEQQAVRDAFFPCAETNRCQIFLDCHDRPVLPGLRWPGPGKKITNDLSMTFIRVEPGRFQMGSPDSEPHRKSNEPQHWVEITEPFYLQETEVTLEQWQALMGKALLLKKKGGPQTPVTRVSFYDCQKFIRKLNQMDTAQYRAADRN